MSEGFLRTLSPLLKSLAGSLRGWLTAPRPLALAVVAKAEAEGLAADLDRQAAALQDDQPLFTVMLMGGTGVGKSTLMNALAESAVAQASYTRPTTRDPVVYVHEAVRPERLHADLRNCRIAVHDREPLRNKIIVDTPDLDSNDLANRDTLARLLPHADVVLYVGSQEKYHDRIGWDLFKEQRQRRAFGFVLNKWDRCSQVGPSGRRPDDDLLDDLKNEGFADPKLFRTTAQLWVDAAGQTPKNLPDGEQFSELRTWLELGLTRLEMEAVKARGVAQLLDSTHKALTDAQPPDLARPAAAVGEAWAPLLEAEALAQAEVLANTVEPYRQEIEHHFAARGQQRFRGMMAGYLRITRRFRYAGSMIRERVGMAGKPDEPGEWDLAGVAHDCARLADDRSLKARTEALASKLLVAADGHQFPVALLDEPTRQAGVRDWRERIARDLVDSFAAAERDVVAPTGWRMLLRGTVATLANVLPEITFVGCIALVLWQLVVKQITPSLVMVLMPVYATLGVLILLHVVISLLLPVTWDGIRADFRRHLGVALCREFLEVYGPVPADVALAVERDRAATAAVLGEVDQVRQWVGTKEQQSNIAVLYGSPA
jgi:energy-coupling factor transporter ATP-binding protein EcfA2